MLHYRNLMYANATTFNDPLDCHPSLIDFSNVPEVSIPVMNPDVMRWSLLISQLGYQETEEGQLIFKLYYDHLMNSLQNAKFLMPLKPGENFPKPTDKAETLTLKKEATFAIATNKCR